jgi:hypothetical protein
MKWWYPYFPLSPQGFRWAAYLCKLQSISIPLNWNYCRKTYILEDKKYVYVIPIFSIVCTRRLGDDVVASAKHSGECRFAGGSTEKQIFWSAMRTKCKGLIFHMKKSLNSLYALFIGNNENPTQILNTLLTLPYDYVISWLSGWAYTRYSKGHSHRYQNYFLRFYLRFYLYLRKYTSETCSGI